MKLNLHNSLKEIRFFIENSTIRRLTNPSADDPGIRWTFRKRRWMTNDRKKDLLPSANVTFVHDNDRNKIIYLV